MLVMERRENKRIFTAAVRDGLKGLCGLAAEKIKGCINTLFVYNSLSLSTFFFISSSVNLFGVPFKHVQKK